MKLFSTTPYIMTHFIMTHYIRHFCIFCV